MSVEIQSVPYFYTRVEDKPNQTYALLAQLASEEINLLAFSAVPFGPNNIELTIFPEKAENLRRAAKKLGWTLTGPYHAFLIQGDDQLGSLAGIHHKLHEAKVSIYASSGVTNGQGRYGYVIYVKEQDFELAAKALDITTN